MTMPKEQRCLVAGNLKSFNVIIFNAFIHAGFPYAHLAHSFHIFLLPKNIPCPEGSSKCLKIVAEKELKEVVGSVITDSSG